jgi:predicted phosphodiesterase
LGLVDVGSLIQLVGGDTKDSHGKLLCPRSIAYHAGDQSVEITGTPHTYWLAEDPKNFYMEKINPKAFQIQLVHGDLNDKPVPWQHVLVKDVKTESDLVLSGHYHPGWQSAIRIKDTVFVNPGSIGRLENTGAQRVPRVCIIDVYPDKGFELQYVALKSAAVHPFKDKVSAVEGDPMKDVATLLRLIGDTSVDAVDLKVQLPPAARELGFSEQVIEKAFEVLEEAGTE